jgi:hydrogenase maturation protease
MNAEAADVLLIGFGNPGRLDDGLGPALADAIEKLNLPGVTVEADYQLTVEDAAEVARHGIVVFADADVGGPEPFWVKRIGPASDAMSFSTHSVEPRAVLTLARDLFGAEPECYLMGIRGYEFNEFGEVLSEHAKANLAEAVSFVERAIRERDFCEVRPEAGDRELRTGETEE